MGAADVVPGVSGGTVALLLGIYDRLVAEIRQGARALGSLVRGRVARGMGDLRRVDWSFLGSLGGGIVLAVVVLVGWLRTQMEHHPVEVSAVFLGLVAGSIVVARREVDRWDLRRLAVMATTAVAMFFLLGLRSGGVDDPALPVVFGAGALAICAMILPGISGSFVLLMLGLYDAVINAVDGRDFPVLGVFALGCLVGIVLFSQVLDWALSTYHDIVVAAMVGLLIGSFRVLWPWPGGVDSTEVGAPTGNWYAPVLLGLVAAAVVVGITLVVEKRSATHPSA